MNEKVLHEERLQPIEVKNYDSAEKAIIRKLKLETIRKIDNCVKQLTNKNITVNQFDTYLEMTNAELDHIYARKFMDCVAKKTIDLALL